MCCSKHAEVLIYDWSEGGDAEVLVEDICSINFDKHTNYDTQLEDWRLNEEWDWKAKRITWVPARGFISIFLFINLFIIFYLLFTIFYFIIFFIFLFIILFIIHYFSFIIHYFSFIILFLFIIYYSLFFFIYIFIYYFFIFLFTSPMELLSPYRVDMNVKTYRKTTIDE